MVTVLSRRNMRAVAPFPVRSMAGFIRGRFRTILCTGHGAALAFAAGIDHTADAAEAPVACRLTIASNRIPSEAERPGGEQKTRFSRSFLMHSNSGPVSGNDIPGISHT